MNPTQLADAVERVIRDEIIPPLRDRITGIGAEQYSGGDTQRLEIASFERIVADSIEEIDDCLVYLATLRFRLEDLRIRVAAIEAVVTDTAP